MVVAILQAGTQDPRMVFEIIWALTNIASGTSEHTHAIISANALPLLLDACKSDNHAVREQAVWAIGNVAGDGAFTCDTHNHFPNTSLHVSGPPVRDLLLSMNAMEVLLTILNAGDNPPVC